MTSESIKLASIRLDGGTQPRAAIDPEVVADYRERMEAGDVFPPVIVFFDGTNYWLADGFHRAGAALAADFKDILAEIKQGTIRDAKWYSFGANKANGQRRVRGDISRAVEAILADPEWAKTSQRKIAEHVGCAQSMISYVKESQPYQIDKVAKTAVDVTDKRGRTYSMDTGNIGRTPAATPAPAKQTETTVVDTDTGEVIDNAEVVTTTTATTRPTVRGIGLDIGYQAIALLKTIPVNDGLLTEAMDLVVRWVEHTGRPMKGGGR